MKAVIFDMDGTLIKSGLDFDLIRQELSLKPKAPLLEALRDMPDQERRRGLSILERHEDEAARGSTLFPHVRETLQELAARRVPVALMTRNSRRSVDTILSKHDLSFDLVRTREDGEIKPSPLPVLEVCRALGVEPKETINVGDFAYDVQAAKAAETLAVLVVHGPKLPEWADQADLVIHSLREIPPLLDR